MFAAAVARVLLFLIRDDESAQALVVKGSLLITVRVNIYPLCYNHSLPLVQITALTFTLSWPLSVVASNGRTTQSSQVWISLNNLSSFASS